MDNLIENLSSAKSKKRIRAFKKLMTSSDFIAEPLPENRNLNVQVRTIYSGAERTPALTVYNAKRLSLPMVAIVDNSSLKAAEELHKTAEPIDVAFYGGAEVSVALDNSTRIGAIALGIPYKQAKRFDEDLSDYRRLKLNYIKKTADKLNSLFKRFGIKISRTEKENVAKSDFDGVGSIYSLLADEIMKKYATADEIMKLLTDKLKLNLDESFIAALKDVSNSLYKEDLAKALEESLDLKSEPEKCKSYKHFISLTLASGGIPSAVYSGNEAGAEAFIKKVADLGFLSVTVNHGNEALANTVYEKCIENDMLPLCRILIDYSRNKADLDFENTDLAVKFNECAYAVVGHEICTAINFFDGLFSKENVKTIPGIADRIRLYSRIGAKGSI